MDTIKNPSAEKLIECHKQAAHEHQEAAKAHIEAAKEHEAGSEAKAKECAMRANQHSEKASVYDKDSMHHHGLTK